MEVESVVDASVDGGDDEGLTVGHGESDVADGRFVDDGEDRFAVEGDALWRALWCGAVGFGEGTGHGMRGEFGMFRSEFRAGD